ncbi:MAG: GLUG motif-containing protein [Candidatus Sumerlaeales bacterium]|nr:GLUG motif-containing protein [Candidatus Sumerlaeales bacterium]
MINSPVISTCKLLALGACGINRWQNRINESCGSHRAYRSMRFLFVSVFVIMFMMCLGLAGAQTSVTPAGDGSEANPYQITELGNLVWMSDTVTSSAGKHFKMMNDIDASATSAWNDGAGFVPIGADKASFKGTFDGNSKKMTGLTVNRPKTDFVGFIGDASTSCTIKNLGLENVNINGANVVGSVVGRMTSGVVAGCYASGTVSGNGFVGGLLGGMSGCEISDCYVTTGSVTGRLGIAGGLVGGLKYGSNMTNCYATVHVIVSAPEGFAGGLVGGNELGCITNCYATGNVSGTTNVGGLVGWQQLGATTDSHASGIVNGRKGVGGLVGVQTSGTITNCYATGSTSGDEYIAGLVGGQEGDCAIVKCYATGNVRGEKFLGGLVGQQMMAATMTDSHATGNVSGEEHVGGLVGLQGGTIKNCFATGNVNSTADNAFAGGLIGLQSDDSTVAGSYATGSVKGKQAVGGLIGMQRDRVTVESCYASGSVDGYQCIGGLVGLQGNGCKVMNCYATGSTSGDEGVGGLVGSTFGSITGCYAVGKITSAGTYFGGITGLSGEGSTVTNSYFDKDTTKNTIAENGTPKTTSEMKQRVTFVGWDFEKVWKIDEGASYPQLISVPNP